MSRVALAACLGIVVLARPVSAQFEVSAHGGVHLDRAAQSDRVVTEGGSEMYAAAGEASTLGARLGYWVRPALGLQLDLSRSSNASWYGSTPDPSPSFANRTTYLSARGVARTSPTGGLQLFAAAGPALMLHGGTGTNLRTRDTDIGGVLEVGARMHLAGRFGAELALSNYFYGSRYTAAPPTRTGVFRHDLLITTGLVLSWP